MTQPVMMAMRLIEGFIALMMGRPVPVHWDGRTSASVDSKGRVNLPKPKTGEAAEIALLTRLAVHECGHLAHTEKGWATRLTSEELGIFNALEDPRIEKAQTNQYPGASVVLSRGLDELLPTLGETLAERLQANPASALELDILLRGFTALAPHPPMVRHGPALLEQLAPWISTAERDAVDEALGALASAGNSLDAERIARALLARLKATELAPPPPAEQEGADEEQDAEQDAEQEHDGTGGQEAPQQPPEPSAQDKTAEDHAGDEQEATVDNANPQPDSAQNENPGSSEQGAQGSGADESNEGAVEDGAPSDPNAAAGTDTAEGIGGAVSTPDSQASSGQGQNQSSPPGNAGDQQSEDNLEPGADDQGAMSEAQQANNGSESAGNTGAPLDLGTLLRETLVKRYGATPVTDEAEKETLAPLTGDELENLRVVLAGASSEQSLEQLLEASMIALAEAEAGGDEGQGDPCDGAGMSFASPTSSQPNDVMHSRLQGVQSRLVTVIQRELQDKKRQPTRAARAGARIIPQRFWRLQKLGDTKVFSQRRLAGGIDAAATVLVDSSESMYESLVAAVEMALAFSLALQRLGVKTKVVRFPGAQSVTETLQRFGEPARACVQRCASLVADGGTPVGAACILELEQLLAQRRLKNLLVVVTDDGPGDPDALAAAIQAAYDQDVLVVGVGIGCDIRAWIPTSISVANVEELPDALRQLFRENISMKLAA